MQNRLATAIMMAVGNSLAAKEENGTWKEKDVKSFLENVSNTVTELLNGNSVKGFEGYPTLKLSGANIVASSYGELAAKFLQNENSPSYEQGGYNE